MVAVAGDRVDPAQLGLFSHADGLEEVQHPGDLLRDAAGLLARGGCLVGPGLPELGATGAFDLRHRAAVEGGGVHGGEPVLLELLVEEDQTHGHSGHVEAGDQLAHLGAHRGDVSGLEQLGDLRVDDEQLFVLHGAQAIHEHRGPALVATLDALGLLGQEAFDQQRRDLVSRTDRLIAHARFAVDAQAHAHVARGHMEQRLGRAGQGGAVEGDAEGAGGVVRLPRDPLGLVQARAGLDRSARDLEHRQVAGDTAAVPVILGSVGDDVVADLDDPHVDAFGAQLLRRPAEVKHVPGVVAEAEDHAAAVLRVAGHRVDLRGRGRGEDVAAGRAVAHARAHPAREGGVVAGAAADHEGRLALRGLGRPHHAAVDDRDMVGVGRGEACDRLGREGGRIVEEVRHRVFLRRVPGGGPTASGRGGPGQEVPVPNNPIGIAVI